jgi:hypothetical protein
MKWQELTFLGKETVFSFTGSSEKKKHPFEAYVVVEPQLVAQVRENIQRHF